jgi:hypothetical protein
MKGKDKAETRRKRRLLSRSEGALHLPIFEFCKRSANVRSISHKRTLDSSSAFAIGL